MLISLLFITLFIIDFDGYYTVRTDEGQPRPKYIIVELTFIFFTLQRFGPLPLPNLKSTFPGQLIKREHTVQIALALLVPKFIVAREILTKNQ